MSKINELYHDLLDKVLDKGYLYNDPNREGVQRLEIPSHTIRYGFKNGFPAISTKELDYKNVVTELLWFLKGKTNIKYLLDNKCNIWNKDAYKYYLKMNNTEVESMSFKEFLSVIRESEPGYLSNWFDNGYGLGDLGPVYGSQWRSSKNIDQIKNLIEGLKSKPLGTEHIVNSWSPSDIRHMALPPCHYSFQIVVQPIESGYGFELHWSQRSVDVFLGLPYNIASYATLALIIERLTGYKALGIQGDLKKVHLYDNSIEAAIEQLTRPMNAHPSCLLDKEIFTHPQWNNSLEQIITALEPSDFKLSGYKAYPNIKVEMLEKD